ncbi:hypothetical protein DBV23_10925 [Edwardsiella ictaluri]|uniref:InvB/SpaK family type III secretion system chaperone n=1 Tax=Edwardsiella ictaluri TaxID=67780 RepID=UPI0008FB2255|nr:hypothetical protein [Edwardsiella ictaluri]AVZ82709.1 hypothetical protein DBV23_10925 [Edwardsiella ictaluri]EKS7764863.1 hypothetical protein [Edwardsiella ictaluri]EKS7771772.1 hypothetical protein [Edwardsiella ictaluri]EKS7774960.1 hypothetical protein [Edwardsiella ictaluri]EKS7778197.1 hypothetical protein [Edwardsiella ictaluri]
MINNKLSFSQNIHQDLSSLVRAALSGLGVRNNLLNDFNSHSTISIDLDEGDSISISLVEDRLYIWSLLTISEEQLIGQARSVIPSITNPIPYAEGGGCILLSTDSGYELRLNVRIDALQDGLLGEAITSFYQLLINLR